MTRKSMTHRLFRTLGLLTIIVGFFSVASAKESAVLKLKDSPRLWVSKDTALNLKNKLHTPYRSPPKFHEVVHQTFCGT